MRFRNVKLPEGINVSPQRPLRDFALLLGASLVIFVVIAWLLVAGGGMLARHAPISWENGLAAAAIADDLGRAGPAAVPAAELQALAGRLSPGFALPEGLELKLRYLDIPEVNAFATIGGNVFVTAGLIARMPDENALAMVVAHEIAHLVARDPAAALGGGVLLQLAFTIAVGAAPGEWETLLIGPNALLLAGFSRERERAADALALSALVAAYGHAGGADRVFEIFLAEAEAQGGEPPEIVSTHPLSSARIAAIRAAARARGWSLDGPRKPLPPSLADLEPGG
jgi:Zn-dependent protease with chaperone function